jgi:membrane associated rhomboid family serine protease
MMFPIRDENPQLQIPYVTYTLIALNVIAWLGLQGFGVEPTLSASVCQFGLIPADMTGSVSTGGNGFCPIDGQPDWHTALTSIFMHGSWMHLLGNMWFLWIFGNNVEDAMGPTRFTVFYLLSGLAASAAQVVADLQSPIPMVGASGAIGGVMGAYIVLYPKVHVHMLLFLVVFIRTFAIPAIAMLGYWIVVQVFGAVSSMGTSGGGVAFWAHIGGFIAGMLLIFIFKDEALLAKHPYRGWNQKDHPDDAWKTVSGRRGKWN